MFLRKLLLFIWGVVFFSCNNAEKHADANQTADQLPAMVTARDSTKISYKMAGEGDTTLLFIHGWAINKNYWDSQLAFFSPEYKVVAFDQAGFGSSDTTRKTYSIENYAADVAAVISQLQLKNVVLIGHSMSGDVILETALAYPEQIVGLIGIDNFNQPGKEFSADEKKEIDLFLQGMNGDYEKTVIPYAEQALFQPSTDSSVRKRVKNDILNSNRRACMGSMEEIIRYAPKESTKLGQLTLPLHLLNSDVNKTDTTALGQAAGASYRLFTIQGTGHYPMNEKPAEFNQILRQILGSIGAK